MRDFRDCSWDEGTEAILALLPRLTVMRGMLASKPMRELQRCCEAVVEGNIRAAADACFSMTSALLRGGYRRISGDLLMDLILHKLLLEPHPFAREAAANRLDEALYRGIKDDMELLSALRGLDGETLYRFIQERYKELKQKLRPNRDSATRLAEAAWGGGALRPEKEEPQEPMPKLPAYLPAAAPSWDYGEEELRGNYVADEALEEMYHRFLEGGPDWQGMAEDVWNFFAAYGCGVFLKERMFEWIRGGLFPMEELRTEEMPPVPDREYREFLDHAIEFMRGSCMDPVQIVGAAGMGKTSMLFALAEELPELRFIYVPECRSINELAPLMHILRDQPLKFMVAIDDPAFRGFAERMLPANVLLAAVSENADPRFKKRIRVRELRLEGFIDCVQRILDRRGAELPRDIVRSACVDHQVDSKGELTVAAAFAVADGLMS